MMKRNDGRTGFWEPGFSIFQDELAKEERERLGPLKAELKNSADPLRGDDLRREIAAIEAEFKKRRKNASYSLFAKT